MVVSSLAAIQGAYAAGSVAVIEGTITVASGTGNSTGALKCASAHRAAPGGGVQDGASQAPQNPPIACPAGPSCAPNGSR